MATLPVNLFLAEVEDWSEIGGEVAMLKKKKVGVAALKGVCVRMRIYHSA